MSVLSEVRRPMKERPKTGAFLLIAIAFLCVYFVRSSLFLPRPVHSQAEIIQAPDSAGARLVLGLSLDINSATAEDLELLPGVGSILAARIVEERAQGGAFKAVTDLSRVKGLSISRADALRVYLTVSGTK